VFSQTNTYINADYGNILELHPFKKTNLSVKMLSPGLNCWNGSQ